MPGDAPSSRRSRLSRQSVVAAALAVVDADGLEALTMRRLGAELGADPMAAYRYVSGKAALLDAIVEAVVAGVEIPARSGSWDTWLARLAATFRTSLLSHPRALPVIATRPPVTEVAWRPIEAALAVLVESGFDLQVASDAVDCLSYIVIGHAMAEVGAGPGADGDPVEASHASSMGRLDPTSFPHVSAASRSTIHDPTAIFELAVEGLLRALRARRRAGARSS